VRHVLVDTGPIVALLLRDDANHPACVRALSSIRARLVTVWPVVTEAMHLLARLPGAVDQLWRMLESGVFEMAPLAESDMPRMRALMAKYGDLPMDLADAALVRVAEREKLRTVFTIDRRDFRLYRPIGIGRFTLLP
jgi:predicted nucleic acid-binding protein